MLNTVVLAAGLALCAPPAQACRLALVLGMDVSASVDAGEDRLQRAGLAAALMTPRVQAAFFASDAPVAFAVFEWSGRNHQHLMQDWVVVNSPATLAQVATNIASTRRLHTGSPTAIGYAIGYSAGLLGRAPPCDTQTIDLSGDGMNNDGFAPQDAIFAFDLDGVTVNGLVIRVPRDANGQAVQQDLETYYAQNVIHGAAAFVQVADGFEDFARAMEQKLIRELGLRVVGTAGPTVEPAG